MTLGLDFIEATWWARIDLTSTWARYKPIAKVAGIET